MGRIISYEEACSLDDRVWNNMEIAKLSIYKEASENGNCILYLSDSTIPNKVDIIYKMDDLGHNVIGLYITINPSEISVWEALENHGTIFASKSIINGISAEDSLSEIIHKAKAVLDICPVCKKEVQYKEQQGYSFAGRCCKDCLPIMKRKYEQPGWYN